jgi:hypothetical protein
VAENLFLKLVGLKRPAGGRQHPERLCPAQEKGGIVFAVDQEGTPGGRSIGQLQINAAQTARHFRKKAQKTQRD